MSTSARRTIATSNTCSAARGIRLAALALFAAGFAVAQPVPKFEIRVTVVDRTTNQPVSGVTVVSQNRPSFNPNGTPVQPFVHQQVTDANGVVTFSPPRADTYSVGVVSNANYSMSSLSQQLTADAPSADLRLQLTRTAAVSGTVVDSETREPVAGALVRLAPLGRAPVLGLATPTATDGQGRFLIQHPNGAAVALRIEPRVWAASERYLTKFTSEDAEKTDEDYEPVFPMGGVNKETALPLAMSPGQTLEVGSLAVRKTTYRRVLLRIAAANCVADAAYDLTLRRDGEADTQIRKVPCGQDVLLRGMVPGSRYELELASAIDAPAETRLWADADFVVSDRNIEVQLAPRGGVDLRGRVVLADGSAPWPKDMQVGLLENGYIKPISPDAEGRFVLPNARLGVRQLGLVNLGTAHVIQRIEFQGKALPTMGTRKLDWQGDGELVITLDDQPGSITGEVTDGVKATSDAEIVIANWPLPEGINAGAGRSFAKVDDDGKFTAQRIAAGEYRVFAIPLGTRDFLNQPGVFERMAARAETVKVGRGGSANQGLRVIDPTR